MEDKKQELASKYIDNISDEFLNHLKRKYRVFEQQLSFSDIILKFILIDDKTKILTNNKKHITNVIFTNEENDFTHLSEKVKRRTIKKFLDYHLN